ncbi:DUF962 domain-containing protein [Leptospira meyeri]|uniref:DUF962 domain-containing protein n=1 Tax=Leptospira meyeri TaxID=29508 RepID=UPI00223CD99B|nr:DUF962 domain-containing protein [Leptospira meyeri]MCW7490923.1 DUF962 domain-containing protein [Leptospira meyeri]
MKILVLKDYQLKVFQSAIEYWHLYLWHHRNPLTRFFHRIGSYFSLFGIVLSIFGYGILFSFIGISIGYGFAFYGHFTAEKNRPLTFKSPIKAGICNWVLFIYEIFFDVEAKLKELERLKLNTAEMSSA